MIEEWKIKFYKLMGNKDCLWKRGDDLCDNSKNKSRKCLKSECPDIFKKEENDD